MRISSTISSIRAGIGAGYAAAMLIWFDSAAGGDGSGGGERGFGQGKEAREWETEARPRVRTD
jgi:hypothetical protein